MIDKSIFDNVLRACCDYSKIKVEEALSKRRDRAFTNTRAVAINIYKLINPSARVMVLGAFINRDHSTVVYYMKNHESLMEGDMEYRDLFLNTKILFEGKISSYNDKISPFENLLKKYKNKSDSLSKLEIEYESLLQKYNKVKEYINN